MLPHGKRHVPVHNMFPDGKRHAYMRTEPVSSYRPSNRTTVMVTYYCMANSRISGNAVIPPRTDRKVAAYRIYSTLLFLLGDTTIDGLCKGPTEQVQQAVVYASISFTFVRRGLSCYVECANK